MELLDRKKWTPHAFREDDGSRKEGAPYLQYVLAPGSVKVRWSEIVSRVCAEKSGDLTRQLNAALVQLKEMQETFSGEGEQPAEAAEMIEQVEERCEKLRKRLRLFETESMLGFMGLEEGFEAAMEVALEYVVGVHGITWGGDKLDWESMPVDAEDGTPSRRALLDRLSPEGADWKFIGLLDLVDAILSGLTSEQKKTWMRSLASDTEAGSPSDATAPSAQDSPTSKTSDASEETST